MTVPQAGHGVVEDVGAVVVAVVGDDPVDLDPVGGEEGPGSVPEPDRGLGFLVVQGLGVGQPAVPVDCRVQVGVSDPGTLAAFAGQGRLRAAAVGPPAASVGDPAELLHIQVDHVSRAPGIDPLRRDHGRDCSGVGASEGVAGRGEVAQSADTQPVQPPSHGAQADHHGLVDHPGGQPMLVRQRIDPTADQVVVDPGRRPLQHPAQRLDPLHHRALDLRRAVGRGTGDIDQCCLAVLLVTGDPFVHGVPGHPELGGHVRDR